jgi:hypothetical protein
MKKLLPLIALFALACSSSTDTEPAGAPKNTPAAPTAPAGPIAVADGVYHVECGCALKEVGGCGNYIEIDGTYHEIAGVDSLGAMEWCGQKDNTAKAKGSLVDGKFVAASFEKIPK